MKQVHWYPGHIDKTIRDLEQIVKKVDIVIILLDARAPFSTFLSIFSSIVKQKRVLIILTKIDLVPKAILEQTIKEFSKNYQTLALNLKINEKNKIKKIFEALNKLNNKKLISKVVILGVPNVGKSTIINFLANYKKAKVEDRAGVTRNMTWFNLENYYILDTPGILEPHVEDINTNYRLALIGSIKQSILPIEDVGEYLLRYLIDQNKFLNFTFENYHEELEIHLEKNKESKETFYKKLVRDFQRNRFGTVYLDSFSIKIDEIID